MKYSIVASDGLHYGVEANGILEAKMKANSKGKQVVGIYENSNDGENTPTGEELTSKVSNLRNSAFLDKETTPEDFSNLESFFPQSATQAYTTGNVSSLTSGAEAVSLPLRMARAGYTQGIKSLFGDRSGQEGMNKAIANQPANPNDVTIPEMFNKEIANPVNYIPGIGEIGALAKIGKYAPKIAEYAPKVVEFLNGLGKAKEGPNIATRAVKQVVSQAPRALAEGGYNALAQNAYNSSMGDTNTVGAGDVVAGATVASPLLAGAGKAGKYLMDKGGEYVAKSVGVPIKTMLNSANAPDVSNLLNYKGKENIVPLWGGLGKLNKNIEDKLHETGSTIGNSAKELTELGAQIDAEGVRADALAQLDKMYLEERKINPDKYDFMKKTINNEIDLQKRQSLDILKNQVKGLPALTKILKKEPTTYNRFIPFDLATHTKTNLGKKAGYEYANDPMRTDAENEAYDLLTRTYKDHVRGSDDFMKKAATGDLDMAEQEAFNSALDRYKSNVDDYASLVPWKKPVEQASARETKNMPIGLRELLPLGMMVQGDAKTSAAGIALAGLLHATRGPGLGNLIYKSGQTFMPNQPAGIMLRQAAVYPALNKYAPQVFGGAYNYLTTGNK